jgi:hypothetical protein
MKGGDRLPGYGEFVAYDFQGRTLMGMSVGVVNPDTNEISVYIPENDDFETMEFPREVKRLNRLQKIMFLGDIRNLKLSNSFTERFPGLISGGKTRKRKNKNKKTRKR